MFFLLRVRKQPILTTYYFLMSPTSTWVQEVSGLLRQKYLAPYQNNSKTATGKLFGAHARPMICLPVQPLGKNKEPISVHFLVDTGAPTSFISKQALLAIFNVPELALIDSPGVNIWGTKLAVNPSCAHWQGINLLGANYLRKAQLAFQCIYDQDPELECCKLEKRRRNDEQIPLSQKLIIITVILHLFLRNQMPKITFNLSKLSSRVILISNILIISLELKNIISTMRSRIRILTSQRRIQRAKTIVSETQTDHGEANLYVFSSRIHLEYYGIWHT